MKQPCAKSGSLKVGSFTRGQFPRESDPNHSRNRFVGQEALDRREEDGRVRVAFGLKAHSGGLGPRRRRHQRWRDSGHRQSSDRARRFNRRRFREPAVSRGGEPGRRGPPRDLVGRGVAAVRPGRGQRDVQRPSSGHVPSRHLVAACAVLVPEPMPAWSVERNPRSAFPHAQSRGRTLSRLCWSELCSDMRTECCHSPGKTTGGARGKRRERLRSKPRRRRSRR